VKTGAPAHRATEARRRQVRATDSTLHEGPRRRRPSSATSPRRAAATRGARRILVGFMPNVVTGSSATGPRLDAPGDEARIGCRGSDGSCRMS